MKIKLNNLRNNLNLYKKENSLINFKFKVFKKYINKLGIFK